MTLLALANTVDKNQDVPFWLALAVLSVLCGLEAVRRMRAGSCRGSRSFLAMRILLWVTVSATAFPLWFLFGWETEHTDTGLTIRRHRWFGRVTELVARSRQDHQVRWNTVYGWRAPWVASDPYGDHFLHSGSDNNLDGRFDTWFYPSDEKVKGQRVYVVKFDFDLDGSPDFETETTLEAGSVPSSLSERVHDERGFY